MKEDAYIYDKGDREYTVAVTKRYAEKKYELDKMLEKLIAPIIKSKELRILDAGCGIGHLMAILKEQSPASMFTGVDQTAFIINEAKKLYGKETGFHFELGDIEDLPQRYRAAFDVTISRAVLSWLPYYEAHLQALIAVTKKHLFIASLFYDGDIDFITQVREFKLEAGKKEFSAYQNVYSLPRFTDFLKKNGAKKVSVHPFEIGIDIPRGDENLMGTYTEKTIDGRHLQISGAILMSWKWIHIEL
ncbi:MAG: hypothetical protein A2849_01215 [Candidatus Taylorbacteria bacterium RIFCSPHIGHO2_01_FULL_51_15]|uniref:Methyltransferase domain-containing protein n=1 Tax=Candidatus Taylorbacteria bacterium RIFCSPHIGHO2_01_FULL_51_15 TaxID=1802304 RepID=A0A1G2MB53_9BACT|nr:MAG: hypothetical protein A2849_01215 [Candidatus Taylorbacteria bacterium RIFCSPHIGHO2_01_FULL_51_15]